MVQIKRTTNEHASAHGWAQDKVVPYCCARLTELLGVLESVVELGNERREKHEIEHLLLDHDVSAASQQWSVGAGMWSASVPFAAGVPFV